MAFAIRAGESYHHRPMRWTCPLLILAAVSISGPGAATPTTVIMTGAEWNEEDARESIHALAAECRSGAWIERFRRARGTAPRAQVHAFANRSSSVIDSRRFQRELAAALKGITVRGTPNVFLTGAIYSQGDPTAGRELRSYLVQLHAIDLESAERLWIGVHRIRKRITSDGTTLKVTRLKPGETTPDPSGEFQGADGERIATLLVRELLASRLLQGSAPPVLEPWPLRNRTNTSVQRHLVAVPFERGILSSGKARLLIGPDEQADLTVIRQELLGRRAAKRPAAKLTPTYQLNTTLSLRTSATAREERREYTVELEAVLPGTFDRLWSTKASVKKVLPAPKP
jgi:hypothetical protein